MKAVILTIASTLFVQGALAQWHWIDKDGRKVFSDRAPAPDVPKKNILMQPALSAVPASSPTASAPATPAPGPRISGNDVQLEARKKQAEEEETARKKTEKEKFSKLKADNCEQAKKALATVQSGIRLSVTNLKGEREFMDDTARALETKRLQGIAETDCIL